MDVLIFWLYLFLDILVLFIFVDVILSWLFIFWLNLRPTFIGDILDPIYSFVSKNIPTKIWPFEFTPIIIILAIKFLQFLIINFFPYLNSIYSYFW